MLTRNRITRMAIAILAVVGGYAVAPLPASADDGRLVVNPAVYRANESGAPVSGAPVQTVQFYGPGPYGYRPYYRPYARPYFYGGYYPPPPPLPPPPPVYGYPPYGYGYPAYGYGYPAPYRYGPRVGVGVGIW